MSQKIRSLKLNSESTLCPSRALSTESFGPLRCVGRSPPLGPFSLPCLSPTPRDFAESPLASARFSPEQRQWCPDQPALPRAQTEALSLALFLLLQPRSIPQ